MNSLLEKFKIKEIPFTTIISVVLLTLVCLTLIKMILKLVDRCLKKSRIERSLHTFIKTTIKIGLYFLAALVISEKLNIGIKSFVALFSVLGLSFSLASQGLLSNVAGGITTLITKPFVVGDFVEIGGAKGVVIDIDFVHTKINSGDNEIVSIPNSQVATARISNYTVKDDRRVDLEVTASYDDDIEKVKSSINYVIRKNNMVLQEKPVFVRVKEYKDSGISYIVKVWAKNEYFNDVYHDLLEGIKKKFDEDGISMPYNQLEVKIKS
ncbi:MAG: mechanosensitive ion channel family protein [Clostridiales bacterium]|nr:mechanosensitive ion channel family protein [Clostridiales bacterium]